MDMPLPVTGGIMVMASPTQHSARAAARCGRNEIPATAQNEFSSNSAAASRRFNGEPALTAQPFAPVLRRLVFAGAPPEQSANVHRAAIHPAQTDVAPR